MARQRSPARDDPWFWGVDKVVATLCNPGGPFLTRFLKGIDPISIPDLALLERELRKHKVSGLVMLAELTQPVLRNEFGIVTIGQRSVLMHMIMDLRRQSDKYVEFLKLNRVYEIRDRRSEPMSSSIASPSRKHFEPYTFFENLPTSSIPSSLEPQPASPLSAEIFPPPDQPPETQNKSPLKLTHEEEIISPERETVQPTTTSENEIQMTNVSISAVTNAMACARDDIPVPTDIGRGNETYIIDENGKKRRRLVLVPGEATVLGTQTGSQGSALHDPAEQPSHQSPPPTDRQRDPTPSDADSSFTLKDFPDMQRPRQKDIFRRSCQMYLGIESLTVDELFYGSTEIGEEVNHDVGYGKIWQSNGGESSESFRFLGEYFGNGLRGYVNSRMQHYLHSRKSRAVESKGQRMIVQVPYPDSFSKKHHQRSVTVFSKSSGRIIAKRMDRSLWVGNADQVPEKQVGAGIAHAFSNAPLPEEMDDTQWDYLKKWDHLAGQDTVLPILGDSGSEDEETWINIEKENRSIRQRRLAQSKSKRRKLSPEIVEHAIDDAIEKTVERWTAVEQPKLLRKAWRLWTNSRREDTVLEQINLWTYKIQHLETRLLKLRKEILGREWSSAQEVVKQCKSMEASIFDREGCKWRMSTLKLKTAPEKPLPEMRKAKRASNQEQSEGGLGDRSKLSEYESSSDSLGDFIDDEDIHENISDHTNKNKDGALGDSEGRGSFDRYISDSYDDTSAGSHDTSYDEVNPKAIKRGEKTGRRKKIIDSRARAQSPHPVGVIDLTLESESSEGETALKRFMGSSPSPPRVHDTIRFANESDGSSTRRRMRKASSKIPRVASTIICLDSDSAEDPIIDAREPARPVMPIPSNVNKSKRQELSEDFGDSIERTPRKKRKYAVPESQQVIELRLKAQERVERNLKRRFQEMDVNKEDSSMVAVNTGKLEDEEFIYINRKIGSRMQPHQKEGVQFMWREVIAERQGCLIAQTMGLGKTMQVVTLLATVGEAARSSSENIRKQVPRDLHQSRTLILCPPALIENWWEEFLMWTPSPFKDNIGSLRKVSSTLNMGRRLSEIEKWENEGGVLLIGFYTFRDLIANKANKDGIRPLDDEQHQMVEDALLKRPSIIIADEAHTFKSSTAVINHTINRLKSMHRIALTGSPLSNNLEEYHALIDWVAPNFLGTRIEFKANYVERIQDGLYQDSTMAEYRESLKWLEVLKNELRPKVHRADINALRGRLPDKHEFVIRATLTPLQEQMYRLYVDSMLANTSGDCVNNSTLWTYLYTLRLMCSHPKCFQDKLLDRKSNPAQKKRRYAEDEIEELDTPSDEIDIPQIMAQKQLALFDSLTGPHDLISLSNKMQILMDIVKFSTKIGDKVLVFSHHLDILNYVEDQIRKSDVKYSRIDGKVLPTDRQRITKEFNTGPVQVCLISTRAGGQGLNLYGANRVVILDEHFNPMYEEQAVGRAYRMGQKKPVFVYHLIVTGTFEEVIQNQSVFKQQLARRVVDNRNPARRAMKKLGDYLFRPKKTEQKDLGEFLRKDIEVLDRILEKYAENPIIRSMDFTETFQQEDNTSLTAEERKEAEQLQKDERLRRTDPIAYNSLLAQRRQSQAKPSIAPTPTEHFGFRALPVPPTWTLPGGQEPVLSPLESANRMWQPAAAAAVQLPNHNTKAPELEREYFAENVANTMAASALSQANLSPILGGNTTTSLENGSSSVAVDFRGLSINPSAVCIPEPDLHLQNDGMLETLLIDSTTFINQAK